MRAPHYLLKQDITALPIIGDGRQSGTSGSPLVSQRLPRVSACWHAARLDHQNFHHGLGDATGASASSCCT